MVQKVYQCIGHFENAEQLKSTMRDVWAELDEEMVSDRILCKKQRFSAKLRTTPYKRMAAKIKRC
ncbi:MAG: hypothetical protein GY820_15945 [Gammaproteobacteria bacterium]|nr:hypothetical protein [Gammaproteobacteria bacterium]